MYTPDTALAGISHSRRTPQVPQSYAPDVPVDRAVRLPLRQRSRQTHRHNIRAPKPP